MASHEEAFGRHTFFLIKDWDAFQMAMRSILMRSRSVNIG